MLPVCLASAIVLLPPGHVLCDEDRAWVRHTIDDSSRGADGVRLADVNGDGHSDIVTGWEEGGIIRVYLNPGPSHARVTQPWPAVTVGTVKSPEDAVFADLDCDGNVDVISSCEGEMMCMFVHWAPDDPTHYLDPAAWQTDPIPATKGVTRWMFAVPMQLDGRGGTDLVVASKAPDAMVAWLQSPRNARELATWTLHKLYDAGWIMSLAPCDVDRDGDDDLVISDRKGPRSGVLWLENPGADAVTGAWTEHRIGADNREVMFLDVTDLDRDGHTDVVAAVKPNEIHWFRCPADPAHKWSSHVVKVALPSGIGTAKAVRAGDLNGDGKPEVVFSCENATPPKRGVLYLSHGASPSEAEWTAHDVSGSRGVKFDLIQLRDLDRDGDLDILSCEERENLGVFWYENPVRPRGQGGQ